MYAFSPNTSMSLQLNIKVKVKVKSLSRVGLFVTPRTAAYQAPPSMGFSRQEYWSGVPLPSLNSHSNRHQIIFCGFDLHFPDDK